MPLFHAVSVVFSVLLVGGGARVPQDDLSLS